MVLRTLSGRLRPTQARRCSLRSGPSGRHIKDAPPASDAPTACRRATTGAENKPERRLLSCGWSEERKAAAVQPALPRTGSYMSKYPTAIDRAEEMETLRAALAIARIAELELDEKAPILPVKCSHYLIAADADLLIVPANASAVGNHHAVENIMCLSRCDALMVYVVRPGTGKNRVVVDIGIQDRKSTRLNSSH